jgi:phospholipid N-methyltransferase
MADFNSRLRFLGAFVREPLTIGAVWPSSVALARKVVENCDIHPGDTVVELGAGTGVITELVLQRLQGHGRFVPIEIHPMNVQLLRRRFPSLEIVHDSAENLSAHVGQKKADCIISCLAWGSMLPPTQNRIFKAVLRSLAPDGQFVAFTYLHAQWFPTTLRFRKRLARHFSRIESTSVVWRNVPPAFVVNCRRDEPFVDA